MTAPAEKQRARLSLVGIGLWRCERCGAQHDAESSWVEISADGDSPDGVPVAEVLCSECADSPGRSPGPRTSA